MNVGSDASNYRLAVRRVLLLRSRLHGADIVSWFRQFSISFSKISQRRYLNGYRQRGMRSKTYDVNFSSNDARWQNAATVKQLLDILLLAITYNMFDY
jgi:hypothetical protein